LRKYEFFFRPLRRAEFTFLELGVFKGASLRTWADYFEKASIVGVDLEESALEQADQAGGRVRVILGDLSRTEFLQTLTDLGPRVIIDDASHWWPDQLRSLFVLYPALESGGLYVVEDIQTSFEPLARHFSAGLDFRPFSLLAKVAEYMTGNDRPAPIFPEHKLRPLSEATEFHEEIRFLADHTDAITFLERAVILIKK
jgi:trans-aconitate methyltransferase